MGIFRLTVTPIRRSLLAQDDRLDGAWVSCKIDLGKVTADARRCEGESIPWSPIRMSIPPKKFHSL